MNGKTALTIIVIIAAIVIYFIEGDHGPIHELLFRR
jgi:hypothetical protein